MKTASQITGPLDIVRKAAYGEGDPQFDYDKALRKFSPQMLSSEDIAIFADMDSSGVGRSWEADIGELCSTEQWLKKYSLRHYRLDMDCILGSIGFRHCSEYEKIIGKPICSRYADGLFSRFTTADGRSYNVIATRDKLQQFESRLVSVINLYSRRLEWLTTESRRTFGVVTHSNVCIVLNLCTSNAALFEHYIAIVRAVLRQQLATKGRLNLIRSSDTVDCWRPCSVPITKDALEAAISWLETLDSGAFSSATAVAEALMKAGSDRRVEAIYLFTGGDDPRSAREIMLQQARLISIPINVVAFNVFEEDSLAFLRELAATGRGRFHAYTINWCVEDYEVNPALLASNKPTAQVLNRPVISKRYLYGGVPPGAGVREDVFRLYEEIEKGKNNLAVVQTILRDLPEHPVAEKVLEATRSKKQAQRREEITSFNESAEEYLSSKVWLARYGLRARKMDLYDVLAGVAFRHCDGVVDVPSQPGSTSAQTDAIIHQKMVNARYCSKFAHLRWRDGSLVHVQVTGEIHRGFQESLKVVVDAIQKRIQWLKSGSRELFGSILENQVYIVIDISASMEPSLKFVKDKLFQLMQEQIRHKTKFNIVAFNTKVYAWKSRLATVCEENLRNAWQWVRSLECQGSTNTMAALDYAMGDPETEAVYLLTDGRPDQPGSAVIAQATHRRILPVHAISFNCHDAEANQFLADLARVTNGRFHAFSSSGDIIIDPVSDEPEPWESEDVKILKQELAVAREYADTMTQLRKECIALSWNRGTEHPTGKTSAANYRPTVIGSLVGSNLLEKHRSTRPSSVPPEYAFRARPDRMVSIVKVPKYKPNVARHTKTSILRLVKEERCLSPERSPVLGIRPAYLTGSSSSGSESDSDTGRRARSSHGKKKRATTARPRVSSGNQHTVGKVKSSHFWLERHGLTAKRLQAIDVLAPLMFVLHRKVAVSLASTVNSARSEGRKSRNEFDDLRRIMDEVMPPSSHRHMPGGGADNFDDDVDFENLNESLVQYERDLIKATEQFEKHLSQIVWYAIEDRDKRQLNPLKPLEPVPFKRYRTELMPALDRSGWKKINEKDVSLMEKEIETAMNNLKLCRDFQMWLKHRQPDDEKSSRRGHEQDAIALALTPRDGHSKRHHKRPTSDRPSSAAVVGTPVSRSSRINAELSDRSVVVEKEEIIEIDDDDYEEEDESTDSSFEDAKAGGKR